jgi:hypothetical protein
MGCNIRFFNDIVDYVRYREVMLSEARLGLVGMGGVRFFPLSLF